MYSTVELLSVRYQTLFFFFSASNAADPHFVNHDAFSETRMIHTSVLVLCPVGRGAKSFSRVSRQIGIPNSNPPSENPSQQHYRTVRNASHRLCIASHSHGARSPKQIQKASQRTFLFPPCRSRCFWKESNKEASSSGRLFAFLIQALAGLPRLPARQPSLGSTGRPSQYSYFLGC